MIENFKIRKLSINSLFLDQQNPRIGHAKNQKQAYEFLAQKLKGKLTRLAKNITNNNLHPGKLIYGYKHNSKTIIVEGNRRLFCLKALSDPDKVKHTKLFNQFKALSNQFDKQYFGKIQVVVYDNAEDAYNRRKDEHSGESQGAGMVEWGAIEKALQAHLDHSQAYPWLVIVEYLSKRGMFIHNINVDLDQKTTAMDRLFGQAKFKELTGISTIGREIHYNFGNQDNGDILLSKIIEHIAENPFSYKDVDKAEEQNEWLEKFSNYFPIQDSEIKIIPTSLLTAEEEATYSYDNDSPSNDEPVKNLKKRLPLRLPENRTTFAEKKFHPLNINNDRLYKLYNELCKLKVSSKSGSCFEEVGAVMNRVFLDLVTEHAIEMFEIKSPNGKKMSRKTLIEKMRLVLIHIDPENEKIVKFDDFKGDLKKIWKVSMSNQDTFFSHDIRSLNEYVHDTDAKVSSLETKNTFDAYYPYYRTIFDKIGQID